MTEHVHTEDGSSPVAEAVLPLPLEFEALYLANQEAFHLYALLHLGSNDAAEEAVHRAALEMLRHWDALLDYSGAPPEDTLRILVRIQHRLDAVTPVLVGRAAPMAPAGTPSAPP